MGTQNPYQRPRFALDMGQGRFVVVAGQAATDKVFEKRAIVDVIKRLPKGAILVAEATLGSFGFDFADYNEALVLAFSKGIELRAIPIRAVKNLRMDRGHESTKNNKKVTADERRKEDIVEARLLWEIGFTQLGRVTKPFHPRVPRVVDSPSLAVRKAMDGKYKIEAAWLKAHGIDNKDNLLQRMVAVATFVCSAGGTRDQFDKAVGLFEFGTGIVRAQACYHKRLRARLKKAGLDNIPENRSAILRDLRKLSRKIFHLIKAEAADMGTTHPEMGTQNPYPAANADDERTQTNATDDQTKRPLEDSPCPRPATEDWSRVTQADEPLYGAGVWLHFRNGELEPEASAEADESDGC